MRVDVASEHIYVLTGGRIHWKRVNATHFQVRTYLTLLPRMKTCSNCDTFPSWKQSPRPEIVRQTVALEVKTSRTPCRYLRNNNTPYLNRRARNLYKAKKPYFSDDFNRHWKPVTKIEIVIFSLPPCNACIFAAQVHTPSEITNAG